MHNLLRAILENGSHAVIGVLTNQENGDLEFVPDIKRSHLDRLWSDGDDPFWRFPREEGEDVLAQERRALAALQEQTGDDFVNGIRLDEVTESHVRFTALNEHGERAHLFEFRMRNVSHIPNGAVALTAQRERLAALAAEVPDALEPINADGVVYNVTADGDALRTVLYAMPLSQAREIAAGEDGALGHIREELENAGAIKPETVIEIGHHLTTFFTRVAISGVWVPYLRASISGEEIRPQPHLQPLADGEVMMALPRVRGNPDQHLEWLMNHGILDDHHVMCVVQGDVGPGDVPHEVIIDLPGGRRHLGEAASAGALRKFEDETKIPRDTPHPELRIRSHTHDGKAGDMVYLFASGLPGDIPMEHWGNDDGGSAAPRWR